MVILILLVSSMSLLFGTGENFVARRIGFVLTLVVLGYWAVQLVESIPALATNAANSVQPIFKMLDAAVVCIGDGIAYVLKCIVCFIFLFFFMMSYGFLCLFFGRK